MKKLIPIIVITIIIGCAHSEVKCINTIWNEQMIIGYVYTLIDKTLIERYSFSSDGYVLASIGTKKYILWPFIEEFSITAPVYYWKIDDNKNLVIRDDDGTIIKTLSIKRRCNNKFILECDGIEFVYKRSQN